MRGQARSTWVEPAIHSMLQSNGPAADILRAHGARACTDVTGFGVVGHLAEMLRAPAPGSSSSSPAASSSCPPANGEGGAAASANGVGEVINNSQSYDERTKRTVFFVLLYYCVVVLRRAGVRHGYAVWSLSLMISCDHTKKYCRYIPWLGDSGLPIPMRVDRWCEMTVARAVEQR